MALTRAPAQAPAALAVLGINHNTAPVAMREQVAFVPEQMPRVLKEMRQALGLDEVAVLSTCNRTEIYCIAPNVDSTALIDWLHRHHQVDQQELSACSYLHREESAVQHLMRVASGLDSMVLGEPQILGQIKSAYAVARASKMLGQRLEKLFQATFTVAKQVRTDTAIGENPVSVAYAAVSLSQHIFADLSETSALLIGAGKTIDLVARHLRQSGVTQMTVANRTLQRAEELAQQFGAHAVLLSDIPGCLVDADIVIASTASQLPILGKGAVERALKQRRHRPMYMVDIAVPRDIEPEVGELGDVYLYSVDDLKQVIDDNIKSRQGAAQEAETLIEAAVVRFMESQRARDAVSTLVAFRAKAETIRDQELKKALRSIEQGQDSAQVLTQMAKGLTNKLIHSPSIQLKQASADGQLEILAWAERLFELHQDTPAAHASAQSTGAEELKSPPSEDPQLRDHSSKD